MAFIIGQETTVFARRAIEILRSDHIVINMYGDDNVRKIFDIYTAPHKKMPIVPAKYFGAALIRLPETPERYLQGGSFEVARRKCRQAIKAGFVFRRVPAIDVLDDMLAINSSQPVRQGRPIDPSYLDRQQVRSLCDAARELYGVFDSQGRLAAYAYVPICGDAALLDRLLGHGAYLKNGIMYFMVAEIIREMIRVFQREAHPVWVAYDMFLGAKPGLTQFKRSLGFRPYRVSWRWRQ